MARRPYNYRHGDKVFQPFIGTTISVELNQFLLQEARRMTKKLGRSVTKGHIVKALITAYYEKRVIGLLVEPDD
jgi:hypothetical protein